MEEGDEAQEVQQTAESVKEGQVINVTTAYDLLRVGDMLLVKAFSNIFCFFRKPNALCLDSHNNNFPSIYN